VFGKILQKLSKCETKILMMDATHLKSGEPKKRRSSPRHIGQTNGGLGASYMLFVTALGGLVSGKTETAGNVNDIVGAGESLKDFPEANYRLPVGRQRVRRRLVLERAEAVRGLAANYMPSAMLLGGRRGVGPCIPSINSRKVRQPYYVSLYKRRHKIVIHLHPLLLPLLFELISPDHRTNFLRKMA
jgi:hypothetical protein